MVTFREKLISCGTTAPLRCGLRHGWMVAILWRAYRRACRTRCGMRGATARNPVSSATGTVFCFRRFICRCPWLIRSSHAQTSHDSSRMCRRILRCGSCDHRVSAFHMPSRLLMSYAGVSHNLLKRGMACSKPVISRRCRCSRCPARMSSTAGNGRLTLTLRWLRIVCI